MWQQSRKRMARFGPALAMALVAWSVTSGQDVKTDYLPRTDFSKYRSYKWVTPSGAPALIGQNIHPNQILDAQIKESVDSQLAGKGFTKVDGEKTDLVVDYQILVNQERQWNATGMRNTPYLPGGMDTGMGTATSSTIYTGTLVLNIYDFGAKQLVWTGFARKEINLSKDQQKNRKNLDKTTQKLLKDFPPRQK
jgi:hypothetical protein